MNTEKVSKFLAFVIGFLEGFEDDETQDGVSAALNALRNHLEWLPLVQRQADTGVSLAEYASYAEIVGGITTNRSQIRKWCDEVFDVRRQIAAFDDEDGDAALDKSITTADDAIAALIATGLGWSHQYFQSLEWDEEAQFQPLAPHCVSIVLSWEDEAIGWGASFVEAAIAAINSIPTVDVPAPAQPTPAP